MTTLISQCQSCKWFMEGEAHRFCAAFPSGIPIEIILNVHDHRKPFDGDNNVLWTQTTESRLMRERHPYDVLHPPEELTRDPPRGLRGPQDEA